MPILLRATNVQIDTALIDGDNWVRADIQTVETDNTYKILSQRVADRVIYRRIEDVALEQHVIKSVLTGEHMTLTTADIGRAVKAAVVRWMLEDFNSSYDASTGLVILNDNG